MKIIIDAMGGDFAPEAPVRGALLAREKYGADIILTGRTADILRELEKAGCKDLPAGHRDRQRRRRSWRSATIPRRPSSRRRIPRSPWD